MSLRLCVAHMNKPALLEEARYTPFTDSPRAVTAPEQASSVKVADFFQSLREMVTISADADFILIVEWKLRGRLTMGTSSDKKVFPRRVPYRCTIMLPFWGPTEGVCSAHNEARKDSLWVRHAGQDALDHLNLLWLLLGYIPYDELTIRAARCLQYKMRCRIAKSC